MIYFLIYVLIGFFSMIKGYWWEFYTNRQPLKVADIVFFPLIWIFWPIYSIALIKYAYDLDMRKVVYQRPSKEEELERDVKNLLDN